MRIVLIKLTNSSECAMGKWSNVVVIEKQSQKSKKPPILLRDECSTSRLMVNTYDLSINLYWNYSWPCRLTSKSFCEIYIKQNHKRRLRKDERQSEKKTYEWEWDSMAQNIIEFKLTEAFHFIYTPLYTPKLIAIIKQ